MVARMALVMQAVLVVGCPYRIDAHYKQMHLIALPANNELLRPRTEESECNYPALSI